MWCSTWLCSISLLALASLPCGRADYLAGVGIGDVTGPSAEINFMGYAKLQQSGEGIHLRQFSRAFIFEKDGARVVFVTSDIQAFAIGLKRQIISELSRRYGSLYSEKNVILSATHNHSGPGGFLMNLLFDLTILGFVKETFDAIVTGTVRMAESKNMYTMGELIGLSAHTQEDNIILERIKSLALQFLPQGWRDWKIYIYTVDELLGNEVDHHILNKIRFALPTDGIARAFSPECTSLPKKVYKNIRMKMLEWPFCVGLIISPSSLGAKIRGSSVRNELIIGALSKMFPLRLTRNDADKQLKEGCTDNENSMNVEKIPKAQINNRLIRLEERFDHIESLLDNVMMRFTPYHHHNYPQDVDVNQSLHN